MKTAEMQQNVPGHAAGTLVPLRTRVLQRCACGKSSAPGECAVCRQKRLDRHATETGPSVAPPVVHDVLRTSGRPLDATARAVLEPRFGHDFSHLRIHADAEAADSARAVEAVAYTVGNHIAFAGGRYQPGTEEGQLLLAHELAHVVQQSGASGHTADLAVSPEDGIAERQADVAARNAMSGRPPGRLSAQTAAIARVPDPTPPAVPGRATVVPAASSSTMDSFVTGSATIPSQAKLAELAQYIRTNLAKKPGSYAIITGHTDAVGSETSNDALGLRRAESTKAGLVALGLPAVKLTTASAGAREPAVNTSNQEPKNRRVEVHMVDSSQPQVPPSQADPTTPKDAPSPWWFDPSQPSTPPWKPKLGYPLDIPDNTLPGPRAQTLPPDFWNPKIPPNPIKPSPSALEWVFSQTVDPLVKKLGDALHLSQDRTKQLTDLVHDGILKGSKEALKAALDAAHATPQEISAAQAAFEAGMKAKEQPNTQ